MARTPQQPKKIEELNKMLIVRKIIDNGNMQRLNIPNEILNLEGLVNIVHVEADIDLKEKTITWRPCIDKATVQTVAVEEEEEEEE